MDDTRKGKGKFAKLRDAYKAAKARYRAAPTEANLAVMLYLEQARGASILLSNLRRAEEPTDV